MFMLCHVTITLKKKRPRGESSKGMSQHAGKKPKKRCPVRLHVVKKRTERSQIHCAMITFVKKSGKVLK